MLKFSSNIVSKLFAGKPLRRRRTYSYWTETYPSPELSWLKKTVNKTGDWLYNGIDNFFQGPADRYIMEFHRDSSNQYNSSANQIEWELNQNIVDIAFKDITSSISWMIPGFVRKYAIRFYQVSLLYFFTDVASEEESSEWAALDKINHDILISDKKKILYTLQEFKDRIDSTCMSINNWLKKFISSLKVLLRLEEEKKTYYLPGYFALQGNGYIINSQNRMIRGPDKSKLNPAFSFHKRI